MYLLLMVFLVKPFPVSFVKCKAPFLVASPASLQKYSSFVIVQTINGEKSEKKNTREKNVQRKGNYFKRARREEIIKFLVDKNLTLVPEYFKPEYRILFDTFQGL